MRSIFIPWAVSAFVLLASAAWLGGRVRKSSWGIFVDSRGRFSLTQMQLVLWTVVVLSLIVGVFVGRLLDPAARAAGALNFTIPNELLLVMGISIGSAAVATAIKTNKDVQTNGALTGPMVASRPLTERNPGPAQALMVEEGSTADEAIDIGKFQNFWFTLILIAAYVALAITAIMDATNASAVTELPGFDAAFVTLLGISHAGYLAGKIPNKPGIPGTIIAFEPKFGPVGQLVTITAGGNDLGEVTEVRFNKELATNLQLIPDGTSLGVSVPQLQPGRVPVHLIAPNWKATAADTFEVRA